MELSIIIPMYNAEEFIEDCVKSVVSQDLDSTTYEIVVVNDGSKDRSPEIVRELRETYPNIKLIDQINKGNGAARNTGLDNAIGDYIYFLDADDYIAHNVLGKVLPKLYEHNLDIIGFRSVDTPFSDLMTSENAHETVALENIGSGMEFIVNYDYAAEVWWYITKRTFLIETEIQFYDRKFVQDSYYTPSLFLKAKRMAFLPMDVHRYRKSLNSITRKKEPAHYRQHITDMLFSVHKLDEIIHGIPATKGNEKCTKRLTEKKHRYVFLIMTRIIRSDLTKAEINKALEDFKKLDAYPIKTFSGKNYNKLVYGTLRYIFNHKLLFFTSLKMYRTLKRIRQ